MFNFCRCIVRNLIKLALAGDSRVVNGLRYIKKLSEVVYGSTNYKLASGEKCAINNYL